MLFCIPTSNDENARCPTHSPAFGAVGVLDLGRSARCVNHGIGALMSAIIFLVVSHYCFKYFFCSFPSFPSFCSPNYEYVIPFFFSFLERQDTPTHKQGNGEGEGERESQAGSTMSVHSPTQGSAPQTT